MENCCTFVLISLKLEFQFTQVIIGSENGLASNRQQGTIWTDDGLRSLSQRRVKGKCSFVESKVIEQCWNAKYMEILIWNKHVNANIPISYKT